MKQCELCKFNNPKGTATAVIIKDGRLLLLRRNEEPFKGMLDLPGGYMNQGELPEETLKREVKEELGVDCSATLLGVFPGRAEWHGESFSILSHAYFVEPKKNIKINKKENSSFEWLPIAEVKNVAFDSNKDIVAFLKKRLNFNLARVKELVGQLDKNAEVSEPALLRAALCGYVSIIYDGKKLIGMGWIFPRQTMLRRQAVIEDMIVDEAYRGRGYGEKLVLDLMNWAKKEGIEMIELTSNPTRIAANELYKKVGFQLHPTNHYLYKV